MIRITLLATAGLLVGCASARTSALVASDSRDASPGTPRAALVPAPSDTAGESLVEPVATPEPAAVGNIALDPARLTAAATPVEESLYANRFTVKAGYYGSTEDALEDGYIVEVSWMRFMSKLIGLELEIGYADLDGSDAGVDTDVWSIPIFLNGRFNVPIWVLEGYAGVGVGGFYYDAEAKGALTADDSGFLFGGDAFLGASINVADALALGLEAKYYVTDEISDLDTGLDAFSVVLTLGFSR